MRSNWLYLAMRSVRGGAGLDLAHARGDREIGDKGVFGLAGAVGNDAGVPSGAPARWPPASR